MKKDYSKFPELDPNEQPSQKLISGSKRLLAEAIELIKNAESRDGQTIVLTQDIEALQDAIDGASDETVTDEDGNTPEEWYNTHDVQWQSDMDLEHGDEAQRRNIPVEKYVFDLFH